MKKILLLVVVSLFTLTGCLKIEGVLTIDDDLKLTNTDGKEVEFTSGVYKAVIKPHNYHLTLGIESSFWNPREFYFNTGEVDFNAMKDGDQFYLTSSKNGQPYDVRGVYRYSEVKSLEVIKTVEKCSIYPESQHCSDNPTSPECSTPTSGQRKVEYNNLKKTTGLTAELLKSGQVIGTFTGRSIDISKDYIFSGDCVAN